MATVATDALQYLHNIRICSAYKMYIFEVPFGVARLLLHRWLVWSGLLCSGLVCLAAGVFIVCTVIKLCCFKASTLNLCNKGGWGQSRNPNRGGTRTFYIFEQLKCATHCAAGRWMLFGFGATVGQTGHGPTIHFLFVLFTATPTATPAAAAAVDRKSSVRCKLLLF